MTCEQGLPGAAGVACLGRTGPEDQDHEACVGDRVKRAYGFDFANAALGFIMPTLGPSSMSCRMNGARAQIPGSTHMHAGRPTFPDDPIIDLQYSETYLHTSGGH